MKRHLANRNAKWGFESLESRRCLSVSVQVTNGDLVVTGQADGAVEIVATAAGSFQVTDNGIAVGTFTGASDDIRVKLDDPTDSGNKVTIDLAGQTVDQVVVRLGDGDNAATVQGGTAGSVRYVGGAGDDNLTLAAGATVTKSLSAYLGDGNNSLLVAGQVGREVVVRTGDGDDSLSIAAGGSVGRQVYAALGDGNNTTTIGGAIGGLDLKGGLDDDTLDVLAGASVERSIFMRAGDGNNRLTLAGAVGGNVLYRGGDGNDAIEITADATVGHNVNARLGEGDNTFNDAGAITGNLRVTSANPDDAFTVADMATVGGTTDLAPGEQYEYGCHRGGEAAGVRSAFGLAAFGFGRRR